MVGQDCDQSISTYYWKGRTPFMIKTNKNVDRSFDRFQDKMYRDRFFHEKEKEKDPGIITNKQSE